MLTGSMLALGFLHGLGADHLMAIAALSLATPLGPARYGRAFWLAVRFALGHALLLSCGAALVLIFGWQIPVRFEQGGEFAGGCLLIAMGLIVGWLAITGRLYAHAHAHPHGDGELHSHWHLHLGRQHSHPPSQIGWTSASARQAPPSQLTSESASARQVPHLSAAVPGVMGALFAISGLRALMLSLPLWEAPGSPQAFGKLLVLVTCFAAGILASMSLFGIVLAHTLSARRMTGHLARFSAVTTAAGSLVLGIYWICA